MQKPYILLQRNYRDPRHLQGLAAIGRELRRSGVELVVAYTHNDPGFDNRLWRHYQNVELHEVSLKFRSHLRTVWFDQKRFADLCTNAALVILSDDMPTNMALRWFLTCRMPKHIPYLIECGHVDDPRRGLKQSVRTAMSKLLYGRECGILTFSPLSVDYLAGCGISGNILHRHYSTDISRFRAVASGSNHAAREANAIELCFLGYMSERKGLSILAAAIDQLSAAPDAVKIVLRIVGPEVDAALIPRASVINHGFIEAPSQIARALARSDFLILPSFREPWGHAVVEAAAVGLPSLVSTQVGAKMVHENIGEPGLIFAPEVSQLVAAIRRAVAIRNNQTRYSCLCNRFRVEAASFSHEKRAVDIAAIVLACLGKTYRAARGERHYPGTAA